MGETVWGNPQVQIETPPRTTNEPNGVTDLATDLISPQPSEFGPICSQTKTLPFPTQIGHYGRNYLPFSQPNKSFLWIYRSPTTKSLWDPVTSVISHQPLL